MTVNEASSEVPRARLGQFGSNYWAICAIPVFFLSLLAMVHKHTVMSNKWVVPLTAFSTSACLLWLGAVERAVPEPYLDEVFHIPQAQKYCQGKYREWDDKITTPPGLYLLSVTLQQIASRVYGSFECDANSLRAFNVAALFTLVYLALLCRREIEERMQEKRSSTRGRLLSGYALHTALNIGLFPLLFFFSGLYYTDVVSTAVVVGAFLNHLKRMEHDGSSIPSDFITVGLGVVSLFMRQTNVFWTVVFMGGLEAVHAVKTLKPRGVDQPQMTTLWERCKFFCWRYSVGDVHDLPLDRAWPDDVLFTAVSLIIAAICNPVRVARQVWPYGTVLASFVSFVMWNGGVVLGDKSNHVATIHLAQLLYIWPFFAFFSLPLLLPYALSLVNILWSAASPTASQSKKAPARDEQTLERRTSKQQGSSKGLEPTDAKPDQLAARTLFHNASTPLRFSKSAKYFAWILSLLGTIALSGVVVRYNTIIHPFTLADNRHYMFYVFRYTIRRGKWVRYLLIVPYTVSRCMIWGTLAGSSGWMAEACNSTLAHHTPSSGHTLQGSCGDKKEQKESSIPRGSVDQGLKEELSVSPLQHSSEPASTSTGLILLLATALSLVSAPLVEPRYFIVPWVMWRLLVPAWQPQDQGIYRKLSEATKASSVPGRLAEQCKHHDLRLVLETLWFVAINLVTCYIFVAKPYIWRAEDWTILDDGRLQRFMW
ncbi:Dol-P-Glc:GlcManGlcNAc-PP-Dol alpha-1,2-glucosyltransferase [Drechmeria coniospora]|uniref:Dol-P-Glc:Glc(2)Man(9)GlcNAc(2)-PP-Dol alpha-1,2-glucosyltransferase n=1 Tax=Drechmeria coniospora TaxID=98403 RepID=A0A151GPX5_DRECN|nr:Dol-P-Glc:GlcManGlcNAc-PP-Dol alpha-1,2-glucosyltransferase [Drechmeria coniospora]KYK59143.1 Dol-P-Glc:GlcManGlcNAc-PP-Dol alpha-1,2-glucosyltransferase [Drechmeria coniospora]ODA77894.1 hypothetical protein RJ55_06497 [Drechmeria coniospora]